MRCEIQFAKAFAVKFCKRITKIFLVKVILRVMLNSALLRHIISNFSGGADGNRCATNYIQPLLSVFLSLSLSKSQFLQLQQPPEQQPPPLRFRLKEKTTASITATATAMRTIISPAANFSQISFKLLFLR